MRLFAAALLFLVSFGAEAKQSPYPPVTQFDGDRISSHQAQMGPDVVRAVKAKTGAKHRASRKRVPRQSIPVPRSRPGTVRDYTPSIVHGDFEMPLAITDGPRREARVIGSRPHGCPYRYCGCGASLHLFGRIIPALNLAANWLKFPRAMPAPRMAAARRGHVFVLEHHIRGNVWMVWDANSGGHRTRVHPRSIIGFRIVNPHGNG
jgi:hypothetical protein